MKKTLSLLLIFLLVSPAFASWLPHSVIHSLHNINIEHLSTGSHHHSPHEHNHDNSTDNSTDNNTGYNTDLNIDDHHPINIDVVTYFSDYLNADLQRVIPNTLEISSVDVDQIDFVALVTAIENYRDNDSPPSNSHISSNSKIFGLSKLPLYLSTQRLRI
jgi:hypothetical protein